jgi:uncharacterized membrane protein YkoI
MKSKALVTAVTIACAVWVAHAQPPRTAAQSKAGPAKSEGQMKEAGQKSGAAESKVSLKNLPPAVRATVEAETKNATVKGISKEKEKGQTVYELESIVNGRTRDLMIDSAGKVYIVEEQIDADKAPAPVRAALEARGTIVTLESVLESGKTTYEGRVRTKGGKKLTMELDADGRPIRK